MIHTIGHSTRTLDGLVALLRAHGVRAVADVRQYPASRRHPQFARAALETSLPDAGIAYHWLRALGGRRAARPDSPHVVWRNLQFRGYADHMDSPEFAAGLDALLTIAAAAPVAVMCAEAVPWRCHRQLVSDALLARGVAVRHITGPGEAKPHHLTPGARVDGTRVVYDGGQGVLGGRSGTDLP